MQQFDVPERCLQNVRDISCQFLSYWEMYIQCVPQLRSLMLCVDKVMCAKSLHLILWPVESTRFLYCWTDCTNTFSHTNIDSSERTVWDWQSRVHNRIVMESNESVSVLTALCNAVQCSGVTFFFWPNNGGNARWVMASNLNSFILFK